MRCCFLALIRSKRTADFNADRHAIDLGRQLRTSVCIVARQQHADAGLIVAACLPIATTSSRPSIAALFAEMMAVISGLATSVSCGL
jgi:hypothetical protein